MGILRKIFLVVLFLLFPAHQACLFAQAPQDYFSMSLEDLMNIEVTSAAKHVQKLFDVASAMYVITRDDIEHSGAENIAELLRMVPGIHVARVANNSWAVSARGFNSRFANKLLVLIDGRSIYSPIFSGTYWERQNIPLDLIKRIEVIRGPGGSLWGANAVNGIINIITKSSQETQGGHIEGVIGSPEQFRGELWAGARPFPSVFSHFYVNAVDREGFKTTSGKDAKEPFQGIQAGFRSDWEPNDRNSASLSGDLFYGETGVRSILPSLTVPYKRVQTSDSELWASNVVFKYARTLENGCRFRLQTYYDQDNNNAYFLDYHVATFDLDTQFEFDLARNQHWIAGSGYRHISARFDSTWYTRFSPERHKDDIFNFFLQDEIYFSKEKGRLTLGTKCEYNPYTGLEIQPSAKFLWKPSPEKNLWASVAKAVHTPDLSLVGATVPVYVVRGGILNLNPILISYKGNSHFDSEVLWAYEAGLRSKVSRHATFDLALFIHRYTRLLATVYSYEPSVLHSEPTEYQEIFVQAANKMRGEVYGAELSLRYDINDWWSVQCSYTYTKMYLHPKGFITTNLNDKDLEGRVPENMLYVRSSLFLSRNADIDVTLRYVDSLPSLSIPSYLDMDVIFTWRPSPGLKIDLAVQNLFDDAHPEFNSDFLGQEIVEIMRTFYAKVSWSF